MRIFILLCFAVFTLGCGKYPDRPADLPPLHPCKITVTFGGEPKENVTVALISDQKTKWKSGGQTDKKGVVQLKTAFAFDGVPEGDYTIAFSKWEDRVGNTLEEMVPMSMIPLKYGPKESKETISVKKGKNNFKFSLDAGEEKTPTPKGFVRKRPTG